MGESFYCGFKFSETSRSVSINSVETKSPNILCLFVCLFGLRKNNPLNAFCRLIGGSDFKIIYRHYATLYFVFCVDSSESELGILDLIQVSLCKVVLNIYVKLYQNAFYFTMGLSFLDVDLFRKGVKMP